MFNKTEQEIMKNWQGDVSKPVVSVCTITYNHEKYIAEAIDSFLMQETGFPFEIVIGEDCSTDDTRKVIEEYINKYPNIIKLITSENNVGMIPNFQRTIKACQGKYIAFCEGDDYWTDKNKLQIQKDILDEHKKFSAVAHQSSVLIENRERPFTNNSKEEYVLDELIFARKFHTATILCRAKILKKNPLPTNILSGDKAIYILLGLYGPVKFINKSMCIYRKHDGGISSWVTYDMMKKDLNLIPWVCSIDKNFPKYKLLSFIHKTIIGHSIKISNKNLFIHSFYFILYSFSYFPKNIKPVGSLLLKQIPKKLLDIK